MGFLSRLSFVLTGKKGSRWPRLDLAGAASPVVFQRRVNFGWKRRSRYRPRCSCSPQTRDIQEDHGDRDAQCELRQHIPHTVAEKRSDKTDGGEYRQQQRH